MNLVRLTQDIRNSAFLIHARCDKVQVTSIDVSTEDPPTCYSSYLVCEKLQERVDLFQTVDELRECIKYIRNEDFFQL